MTVEQEKTQEERIKDAIKASRIAQLSPSRRAALERKGIDLEAYCIETEKLMAERAAAYEENEEI